MITFYKDNDIVGLADEPVPHGVELSKTGAQRGEDAPTPYMAPSGDPFMGRRNTPFMGSRRDP